VELIVVDEAEEVEETSSSNGSVTSGFAGVVQMRDEHVPDCN
jgi:hypothetical protein